MRAFGGVCAAAIICLVPAVSQAVIVYGAQGRNTTAPSGPLANSGWQYQGKWGAYLGTPISSQHFITAGHVGGSVGQQFNYQGINYTTTAFADDPATDLRIWKINGTFSSYAPLYTKNTENNQGLVVFGRGAMRGDVVTAGTNKGWKWGAWSGNEDPSWGENTVLGIANDANLGHILVYDFSASGGTNEGMLSQGDSGGGLFIKDGATWKLAGINYGAEGVYKYNPGDPSSFAAGLYDQSGLYVNSSGTWVLAPNRPGYSYSTRISSNMAWINSVLVPEPTTLGVLVLSGAMLMRRQRAELKRNRRYS